jgi:RNA polymerase sigma-70 factor (ECF subfamily)
MAFQLTRNRSEAEDLVQTTYVKAWRGFDSYTPGRPFLNWLLRIMQHAYLDSRRRHDIVKTAEPIHATINASSGDVQELPIPDTRPSPEHELLSDEFRAKFYEALNQLPEVYRTAIQLCDIEELSYYEIAEVQQTTVGTVRSRIHRGRKMLREAVIRTGYHRSF